VSSDSDNIDPAPRLGPIVDDSTIAEEIHGQDLAIVLSRYEIGAIENISDYRKGSRRAAKMIIRATMGNYLLKRRAFGRDARSHVEFAHAVQLRLAEHRFPVAGLVKTLDGETLVKHDSRIYELFRFVKGNRFDKSNPEAAESGRVLAQFHNILRSFPEEPTVNKRSFHQDGKLLSVISEVTDVLAKAEDPSELEGIDDTVEFLLNQYKKAHSQTESAGFTTLPTCIVHGDWHPGNMLYKDGEIIAVLDFDSLHQSPRITDVANGALQFSMRMGDAEDVDNWPDTFRGHTIQSMVQSYDQFTTLPLTDSERSIIPALMTEALIVESIIPIHKTGSFGRIRGSAFLRMVERKLRWLDPRSKRVIDVIEPPTTKSEEL